MAEREHVNIRNIYIDLLNKIRNVEGVDKDYVDGLVDLIDQHLTALDQDFNALISVIPEEASVTDPLVITSQLSTVAFSGDYDDLTDKPTIPAAQVNSDWTASTGVSAILHKPAIFNPGVVNAVKGPSNWVSGTDYYTCDISFGTLRIDNTVPPIVWCASQTPGVEPTATNKANFNLIVGADWYYDSTNDRYYCRLYARSGAVPTDNITMCVLGFYQQQ